MIFDILIINNKILPSIIIDTIYRASYNGIHYLEIIINNVNRIIM